MEWIRLRGDCPDGKTCPAVFADRPRHARGGGHRPSPTPTCSPTLGLPAHESVVEIPLFAAARGGRRMLSEAELDRLWDGLEREAFRLETLDRYAVPHEAEVVRRYLTGAPHRETDFARGWADYVAGWSHAASPTTVCTSSTRRSASTCGMSASGGTPATPSAASGRTSSTPPRSRARARFPTTTSGCSTTRTSSGCTTTATAAFIGAELLPPAALEEHRRARDAAIAAAAPFEAYWAAHPEYHRENWLGAA